VVFAPELVGKTLASGRTRTWRFAWYEDARGIPRSHVAGRDDAVQTGRTEAGVARTRVPRVRRGEPGRSRYERADAQAFRRVGDCLACWKRSCGNVDPTREVWVIRFGLAEVSATDAADRAGVPRR
jgi:hypothetical protein